MPSINRKAEVDDKFETAVEKRYIRERLIDDALVVIEGEHLRLGGSGSKNGSFWENAKKELKQKAENTENYFNRLKGRIEGKHRAILWYHDDKKHWWYQDREHLDWSKVIWAGAKTAIITCAATDVIGLTLLFATNSLIAIELMAVSFAAAFPVSVAVHALRQWLSD